MRDDDALAWTFEREVWTTGEIARRLHCPRNTVQGWCRDGLLEATTSPGGHYRVLAGRLRAYLRGERPAIARKVA